MLDIKNIKLQQLRIPKGWQIIKNIFFDVNPTKELKIKGLPDNDGWVLFEQELLFAIDEKSEWIIDMGWITEYDPEGEFSLSLVKKDYRISDPIIICQTKNKDEIVEAINKTMLKISQENADIDEKSLPLRGLIIHGGWTVTHNCFFNVELLTESEKLTFFNQNIGNKENTILRLETWPSVERVVVVNYQITPEKEIYYIAKTFDINLPNQTLFQLETKNVEEVPNIVEKVCLWKELKQKNKNSKPQFQGIKV